MASSSTLESILQEYEKLLIIQYSQQPKAVATIRALISEALANGVALDVRDGYDLDTAVGKQLDVIGKYVDVDRFYQEQILDGYFAFIDYDEVDAPPSDRDGFTDYTDFDSELPQTLTYSNALPTDLSLGDEDYRTLIKLRIAQNTSDHSTKSIDDSLFRVFGDALYMSSANDKTMVYFAPSTLSALMKVAIQKKVLPKPAGVMLKYVLPSEPTFFGFVSYDFLDGSPTATGFTTYADFDTKEGETLEYTDLVSA